MSSLQAINARILRLKAQQIGQLEALERLLVRRRDLRNRHQRLLAELQQLVDTQDANSRQLDSKVVEVSLAHEGSRDNTNLAISLDFDLFEVEWLISIILLHDDMDSGGGSAATVALDQRAGPRAGTQFALLSLSPEAHGERARAFVAYAPSCRQEQVNPPIAGTTSTKYLF